MFTAYPLDGSTHCLTALKLIFCINKKTIQIHAVYILLTWNAWMNSFWWSSSNRKREWTHSASLWNEEYTLIWINLHQNCIKAIRVSRLKFSTIILRGRDGSSRTGYRRRRHRERRHNRWPCGRLGRSQIQQNNVPADSIRRFGIKRYYRIWRGI